MGSGVSTKLGISPPPGDKKREGYRETSLLSNTSEFDESYANNSLCDNQYKIELIARDSLRLRFFLNYINETTMKIYVDSWLFLNRMNKQCNSISLFYQSSAFMTKYCSTDSKYNIIENLKLGETELEQINGFRNNSLNDGNMFPRCNIKECLDFLKPKLCEYIDSNAMKGYQTYEIVHKYRQLQSFVKTISFTHQDFHYYSILGQGTFGMVLKCVSKLNSLDMLAMKVQLKDDMWQHRNGVDILIEQEIFKQHSDHPYIIDCLCSFNTASLLYLVMPLAHCTLGDLCKNCPDNIMSLSRVQFYAAELVCVLKYLHENSFVYCDLKPSNVMIGMDGHVQLTDFGSTCRVNSYSARCKIVMGTLPYMAPEMILGLSLRSNEWEGYTCAVDWWSLGVLIYKLLVGKTPFDIDLLDPIGDAVNQMPKNVLRKVKAMNRYTILFKPVDYSMLSESCSVAVRFMMELLEVQENLRFGSNALEKIEDHPFFDDLEWCDIESKTAKPPFVVTEQKVVNVEDQTSIESLMSAGKGNLSRLSAESHKAAEGYRDSFADWEHISPTYSIELFERCLKSKSNSTIE